MQTVDFSRLDLRPGQRVLDLGCGEGRHALGAALHASAALVGVDWTASDLRTARERAAPFLTRPSMIEWVQASAERLPFTDQAFDHLILSEVLEHLADVDAALDEARRVLRARGTLVVSVPRFVPEWICWRLSKDYHNAPGGHVRIFSGRELRRVLARHGFEVWARHWAHALHTPYWWLQCARWSSRHRSRAVALYHRFLVWDLMQQPPLTRRLEHWLDPLLGKSLVLYAVRR